MPLERNSVARFLAILVLAAFSMPPAASWADGGGAGIQFQIQYDENADEDEEEIETLTARPVGFDTQLSLKYALSTRLKVDLTYTLEPSQQESWSRVTLGGPRFSDEKTTYFTPRFNARFPGVGFSYTPSNSNSSTSQTPRESRPQTWASGSASENLDLDKFTPGFRMNFTEVTPEEGAAAYFGIPPEKARELTENFDQFVRQERARHFLGNESYRKLQEQFGPVNTDAPGDSAKAQPATTDSARDFSGWNSARLYCGGACVGRY